MVFERFCFDNSPDQNSILIFANSIGVLIGECQSSAFCEK